MGILTYYPSITLFSLTLGPDSPSVDEPSGGNLRVSEHWILTNVFATHADILTCASSICPYDHTSTYNTTLPYPLSKLNDAVSVIYIVPVYFRRGVA